MSSGPTVRDPEIVDTVAGLVDDLVGGVDLLGIEVTAATRFHDDLQLESVDLVTLIGMITDVYGTRIDLASRLADMDLDEIIELRLGDLVDLVAAGLERVR